MPIFYVPFELRHFCPCACLRPVCMSASACATASVRHSTDLHARICPGHLASRVSAHLWSRTCLPVRSSACVPVRAPPCPPMRADWLHVSLRVGSVLVCPSPVPARSVTPPSGPYSRLCFRSFSNGRCFAELPGTMGAVAVPRSARCFLAIPGKPRSIGPRSLVQVTIQQPGPTL
jgi:hypothetical protein